MTIQKIIAVDVDGPCAQLHDEWLRRYNRDWNDNVIGEDVTTWNIVEHVVPECGTDIFKYLHDQDLYDKVIPTPRAKETIWKIRSLGHRIIFASSCVIGTEQSKLEWLFKHHFLPRDNNKDTCKDWFPASDKSLVYADVLIDDRYDNLVGFKGKGILFDAPYNRQYADFPRVKHWDEVIPLLNELFTPTSVTLEANQLVSGNRQADYGHPFWDYTCTGKMWGAMLEHHDWKEGPIDPRVCALMMGALKISREVNKPKRDNRVDLAGYAQCADMIHQKQLETEND